MKLGLCTELDNLAVAAAAGFDFVEVNVQGHLMPQADDDAFAANRDAILASPIPIKAANCFVPGGLKITGPEVDLEALTAYAATAFERAAAVGIETIVFGSGGARRIPAGFDRAAAWDQLVAFGGRIAPLAAAQGVTIVVEPLNQSECNVFTAVGESADYVRQIDHPNMKLLVDAFHWGRDQDSYGDLVEAGPLLRHAHIATYANRRAPGVEPCAFGPFFAALRAGGYDGRISIECGWEDLAVQAADARGLLAALTD